MTTLPPTLLAWLEQQTGARIISQQTLAGGCINTVYRLQLAGAKPVVFKYNAHAPADFFAAEEAGLRMLAAAGSRVPAVLARADNGLLLSDLGDGKPGSAFWPALAAMLAQQHRHQATQFGASQDNFIGLTPQPNHQTPDGHAFFASARLQFQGDLAQRQGLLSAADRQRLDRICARLTEWIPSQPAALLHGDLWRGNIHCTANAEPALIDPACHYGWPEAELAMTLLFGELPAAFYDAYRLDGAVQPDWRERAPLYNLYHLLNHLNLFGSSYRASVQQVLRRYG